MVKIKSGHASAWFVVFTQGYEQLMPVRIDLTPETVLKDIPNLLAEQAKNSRMLNKAGKVEWSRQFTGVDIKVYSSA